MTVVVTRGFREEDRRLESRAGSGAGVLKTFATATNSPRNLWTQAKIRKVYQISSFVTTMKLEGR